MLKIKSIIAMLMATAIERLYRQYAIENVLDANADVNALMGGSSAAEVR